MINQHKRILKMPDYTLGILECGLPHPLFVLEDQYQKVKVTGETCIPEGNYLLEINKQLTVLTKKYREKYPWFEYFIELRGIRNFDQVYPHIGNDDEDTAGCPLLGFSADLTHKDGWISQSTAAYKMWYQHIYPKLKAGEKMFWNVYSI